MAYGMQNLPLWISDRMVMAIESQTFPIEAVPYVKYLVLIPSLATVLSLMSMIR
jgi:3-hydroxybutyrate dehydrogenase